MKIIVSPHADDELIGCYSILKDIDIVIFCSKERKKEAINTANIFGFTPLFGIDKIFKIPNNSIVYTPDKRDFHPLHIQVTNLVESIQKKKNLTLIYYTVEKNTNNMFLVKSPQKKEDFLNLLYSSQKALWKNNQKYILFEGILKNPYEIYLKVSLQKEGYHKYPKAPKPVSFLRYSHRHIFHINIWVQQYNDDRDIEYIMFKRWISKKIDLSNMDYKSCEMIARDIYFIIKKKYKNRSIKIEVLEDGENGCEIKDWN